MESRLPMEKVNQIFTLLQTFSKRKKVTLKELQSLLGLLNFACSVVYAGRTFLRRLYDLTCGISKPYHKIRLTKEARADLTVWLQFIRHFNGKTVFMTELWWSSDRLAMYTDAAGNTGYAAVLGSKWFALGWSQELAPFQIAIKELSPIVVALELWGCLLKNHKILFLSDNAAVVHIINNQSCKDKNLMRLVRRLVSVALRFNIFFRAKHIPGRENVVADRLSRLQLQEAFALAPWLEHSATPVPQHLQKL